MRKVAKLATLLEEKSDTETSRDVRRERGVWWDCRLNFLSNVMDEYLPDFNILDEATTATNRVRLTGQNFHWSRMLQRLLAEAVYETSSKTFGQFESFTHPLAFPLKKKKLIHQFEAI